MGARIIGVAFGTTLLLVAPSEFAPTDWRMQLFLATFGLPLLILLFSALAPDAFWRQVRTRTAPRLKLSNGSLVLNRRPRWQAALQIAAGMWTVAVCIMASRSPDLQELRRGPSGAVVLGLCGGWIGLDGVVALLFRKPRVVIDLTGLTFGAVRAQISWHLIDRVEKLPGGVVRMQGPFGNQILSIAPHPADRTLASQFLATTDAPLKDWT